jgi:hypothetical protein
MIQRLQRVVLVACLSLASAVGSSAQTISPPPLTSNRPGIGDSEALVGRGVLQVELGVETAQSRLETERDLATSWAQATLRIGIVDPIELFVNWGGVSVNRDSAAGATVIETGSNDVALGAKFAILDESRHGLTLTVAPSSSFPIGGDDFSSGSYDGSLRFLWARSLPADWDLSGNVVLLRTSDASGRYWDNLVTAGAAKSLSPSLSAFGELAVGLAEPRAWTVDGGIAWVSRQNVQWDASAGVLVRGPGQSWFVSGGLTLRRLPRSMRKAARQGTNR